MKLIVAIIQPEKLRDVKRELFKSKVFRITVSNVIGCGQQGGFTKVYRGVIEEVNLINKVKIEIAVNDEFVRPTIDAIIKAARTGNIGDGKIFVTPLEECIRIRTGDSGPVAIG